MADFDFDEALHRLVDELDDPDTIYLVDLETTGDYNELICQLGTGPRWVGRAVITNRSGAVEVTATTSGSSLSDLRIRRMILAVWEEHRRQTQRLDIEISRDLLRDQLYFAVEYIFELQADRDPAHILFDLYDRSIISKAEVRRRLNLAPDEFFVQIAAYRRTKEG